MRDKLLGGQVSSLNWRESVCVTVGPASPKYPQSTEQSTEQSTKVFHLHKEVLSFYCLHYEMLFEHFPHEAGKVVKVDPEVFGAAVTWMYSNVAPVIDAVEGLEFMAKLVHFSVDYGIPGLERAVLDGIHLVPLQIIYPPDSSHKSPAERLHDAVKAAHAILTAEPLDGRHLDLLKIVALKLLCYPIAMEGHDGRHGYPILKVWEFFAVRVGYAPLTALAWQQWILWGGELPCNLATRPDHLRTQICPEGGCQPKVEKSNASCFNWSPDVSELDWADKELL